MRAIALVVLAACARPAASADQCVLDRGFSLQIRYSEALERWRPLGPKTDRGFTLESGSGVGVQFGDLDGLVISFRPRSDATILQLSTEHGATVTGFRAAQPGRILVIMNEGPGVLTLSHENPESIAADRILCAGHEIN